MRPKPNHAVDENGNKSFSYMCQLKEKSRCKKCHSKNVLGLELDRNIYEILKKNLHSDGELYKAIQEIASGSFEDWDSKQDRMQLLQTAKKQNERSIQALVKKLTYIDIAVMGEITDEIKRLGRV